MRNCRVIQYIELEFYDDFDSYNLEIFYLVGVKNLVQEKKGHKLLGRELPVFKKIYLQVLSQPCLALTAHFFLLAYH